MGHMEENNLPQETTKTESDLPWLFILTFFLVSLIAKFLFDNYQKEIFYTLLLIILANLLVLVVNINYLCKYNLRFNLKEKIWNIGLLILIAGSSLIVYFSISRSRYIVPAERDIIDSIGIPLLQIFGLIALFVSILFILFMLIISTHVYKNKLQDEIISGLFLSYWNYRFLILGLLFLALIFAMKYGVGLFGNQPESEPLKILKEMLMEIFN